MLIIIIPVLAEIGCKGSEKIFESQHFLPLQSSSERLLGLSEFSHAEFVQKGMEFRPVIQMAKVAKFVKYDVIAKLRRHLHQMQIQIDVSL